MYSVDSEIFNIVVLRCSNYVFRSCSDIEKFFPVFSQAVIVNASFRYNEFAFVYRYIKEYITPACFRRNCGIALQTIERYTEFESVVIYFSYRSRQRHIG